ncbi:tannase/feruloyl esterase family alpha/beta hydrolase [Paraburkholderia dipogonis]|nr:tannase/feruloyl esterase family alpha/beta hydrolase [Paraburkholderia dipogonis]
MGLPDFCRVTLVIKPSNDSNINAEVWLPKTTWNGRFLGQGCGGLCGMIRYNALAQGLGNGYATATTDMGTSADGTGNALTGHPEKILDYFPRSTHYMTVAAKTLLTAYYQDNPKYSYWNGCSTGGAQGMGESQVYPDDYDGIVAGHPGWNRTHIIDAFSYIAQQANTPPASILSPAKLQLLNSAVLNAPGCQGAKALPSDPFLNDPRSCKFDPSELLCKTSDASNCLTKGEVLAAQLQYRGMANPATHEVVFPGWPKGTELGWTTEQTAAGYNGYPLNWALGNGFDFRTVDWSTAADLVDGTSGVAITLGSSDLSRFASRGGKLIAYHGMVDGLAPFPDSVNYFDRLATENHLSRRHVDQFARLFLVPGGGHCPTNFDPVAPLIKWVESGVAPDSIPANYNIGGTQTIRPLCAYPNVAAHVGPAASGQWKCVGGATGGYGRAAPRYTQPLVLDPRAVPEAIHMKSSDQLVEVTIDASHGPENFHQWVPSDIKVENVPVIKSSLSADGKQLRLLFSTSSISGFTGGKAPGEPVDLTVSGMLSHAGVQGPFATGVTVRVYR